VNKKGQAKEPRTVLRRRGRGKAIQVRKILDFQSVLVLNYLRDSRNLEKTKMNSGDYGFSRGESLERTSKGGFFSLPDGRSGLGAGIRNRKI